MTAKFANIFLNAIPIILMVGMIPLLENDYLLAGVYATIIVVSLLIKYESRDLLFLIFGFLIMIFSEWIFTSTGVETFNRTTLFGLMPVWLPILWGYTFVAIKRSINILNQT